MRRDGKHKYPANSVDTEPTERITTGPGPGGLSPTEVLLDIISAGGVRTVFMFAQLSVSIDSWGLDRHIRVSYARSPNGLAQA